MEIAVNGLSNLAPPPAPKQIPQMQKEDSQVLAMMEGVGNKKKERGSFLSRFVRLGSQRDVNQTVTPKKPEFPTPSTTTNTTTSPKPPMIPPTPEFKSKRASVTSTTKEWQSPAAVFIPPSPKKLPKSKPPTYILIGTKSKSSGKMDASDTGMTATLDESFNTRMGSTTTNTKPPQEVSHEEQEDAEDANYVWSSVSEASSVSSTSLQEFMEWKIFGKPEDEDEDALSCDDAIPVESSNRSLYDDNPHKEIPEGGDEQKPTATATTSNAMPEITLEQEITPVTVTPSPPKEFTPNMDKEIPIVSPVRGNSRRSFQNPSNCYKPPAAAASADSETAPGEVSVTRSHSLLSAPINMPDEAMIFSSSSKPKKKDTTTKDKDAKDSCNRSTSDDTFVTVVDEKPRDRASLKEELANVVAMLQILDEEDMTNKVELERRKASLLVNLADAQHSNNVEIDLRGPKMKNGSHKHNGSRSCLGQSTTSFTDRSHNSNTNIMNAAAPAPARPHDSTRRLLDQAKRRTSGRAMPSEESNRSMAMEELARKSNRNMRDRDNNMDNSNQSRNSYYDDQNSRTSSRGYDQRREYSEPQLNYNSNSQRNMERPAPAMPHVPRRSLRAGPPSTRRSRTQWLRDQSDNISIASSPTIVESSARTALKLPPVPSTRYSQSKDRQRHLQRMNESGENWFNPHEGAPGPTTGSSSTPAPPRSSLLDQQTSSSRLRDNSQRDLVQIYPGVYVPLRSAMETENAIRNDFYLTTKCNTCTADMFCIMDAAYVICPLCKCVQSLDEDKGRGRHGLGIGFTAQTLVETKNRIRR